MCSQAERTGRRAGIIIISSTASFQPSPAMATYAAAKAFLLHFGESLEAELRDAPVDVVSICPSFTRTEFFARASLDPPPPYAASPEAVACEALAALGDRPVHICGGRIPGVGLLAARSPRAAQAIKLLFARNPALRMWQWPRAAFRRSRRHKSPPVRRSA
jgi:short-subunit dehydrogenase